MYRTTITTRLLVAVGAAGLLATACGGGGDDAGGDDPVIVVEGADGEAAASAQDSTDSTADGATNGEATSDEDAARAFAACMRENGVEDFPDPTVSADGSVDFGFGGGGGPGGGDGGAPPEDGAGAGADDDLQQATEACGDLLAGTSLLPSEEDMTEIEDSLLEAAQCLRDQGIDVDDPDLGAIGGEGGDDAGGPGAGGGPFGDAFDPDDPEVQAAIEACQDVFTAIAPGED